MEETPIRQNKMLTSEGHPFWLTSLLTQIQMRCNRYTKVQDWKQHSGGLFTGPLFDLGERADVVEDPGVVAVQPALGDALLVLGLGGPVAGDGPDTLCTRGGGRGPG